MKKTAYQIAHETLFKLAEPSLTLTQAFKRPEVLRAAQDLGMAFAAPPASAPLKAAGPLLGRFFPQAVRGLRGVQAEVPGVLRNYGSSIKGMFQRDPAVVERPVKSYAKIMSSKAPSRVNSNMATDPTQLMTTEPTQKVFNPLNVPKSKSLLEHEARQQIKPKSDKTRYDWQLGLHYRDAIRRSHSEGNVHNPPRGNTPTPLVPAAQRAAAGAAAAVGAGTTATGLGMAAQRAPMTAQAGIARTPARVGTLKAPLTTATPVNTQTTDTPVPSLNTSRASRGLLRQRNDSPITPAVYGDRMRRLGGFR